MYLAGSTALGHFGGWNDGTGKLIVANIANPAAMTVVTQVNVPGIVNLYRPMVSGNRAIALGDGGTDINFPNPGTVTGLGNITIITFDLTNPQSPTILKSTTTTYKPGLGGGQAQIGRDLFLFSGVRDTADRQVLLLVDNTDPLNPVLTPFVMPSPVTHMVVIGNILHVTAARGGYAAYQIPGLTPTAYTLTGSCNAPVTWTLNGPGTLSSSGLYTAPASFTSPQTVTVTATSRVDATQTASSTITLSDTLLLTLTATSPAPFVAGGAATVQALVTKSCCAIGKPFGMYGIP